MIMRQDGSGACTLGARSPVRKAVLALAGLTLVIVAFVSSYSSALGKPAARHIPVAVTAPPAVLGKLDASPRAAGVPGREPGRGAEHGRGPGGLRGLVLPPATGRAPCVVANGGGHAVAAVLVQLGQQAASARGAPADHRGRGAHQPR